MSSIRRDLLVRLSLGLLLVMAVSAVMLHVGVRWLLTDQFDRTLRSKLGTFTTQIEQEGYDLELDFVDQAMPEYSRESAPEYVQIWLSNGTAVYRSESLDGADLPLLRGTDGEPEVSDLVLPDGRAGRAIGVAFTVRDYEAAEQDPGPAPLVLVLARSREDLDRAFAALLGGTAAGILLISAISLLVARGSVARGLRPLDRFARHVRGVADPVHAPRFTAEHVPDELAPLIENHNDLLERVSRAFDRERRTTANIAHELKTPVAELALIAETAERFSEDPERVAKDLAELRGISAQMSEMISTLLELARMESGAVPLEPEPIDLTEMIRACWTSVSAASEAKPLDLRAPEGDAPRVLADRVALSILVSNLLSNAVDHSPEGDEVACRIERDGVAGTLLITNKAGELKSEDVDKLVEPFWRASHAREGSKHAGLGLSLVARLATLLGLRISFRVEDGRFRAQLDFDTV